MNTWSICALKLTTNLTLYICALSPHPYGPPKFRISVLFLALLGSLPFALSVIFSFLFLKNDGFFFFSPVKLSPFSVQYHPFPQCVHLGPSKEGWFFFFFFFSSIYLLNLAWWIKNYFALKYFSLWITTWPNGLGLTILYQPLTLLIFIQCMTLLTCA